MSSSEPLSWFITIAALAERAGVTRATVYNRYASPLDLFIEVLYALQDPADRGVCDALVRHFADYAVAFMARSTHPDVPRANQKVVASFMADLVVAAVACAPAWWS